MGDCSDSILLFSRMGGAMMSQPTLPDYIEVLLSGFFRQCDHVEDLKAREETTLMAIDRLYDRRLQEIRTHDQMQDRMNALLKGENNE